MDSRTSVTGRLDAALLLRYIEQERKQRNVVIERGAADGSLFVATQAGLLRVAASRHLAAYIPPGALSVSLGQATAMPASSDYAASWQQYMDQFSDEGTVETLVPTRLLARVPLYNGKKKPQCSMYCQLRGEEERGSVVWIRLEIADLLARNPDDLRGFIWQLSATGLVRAAQISGWCAVLRPDTPTVYPSSWQLDPLFL